jgi:hypothetical protein
LRISGVTFDLRNAGNRRISISYSLDASHPIPGRRRRSATRFYPLIRVASSTSGACDAPNGLCSYDIENSAFAGVKMLPGIDPKKDYKVAEVELG